MKLVTTATDDKYNTPLGVLFFPNWVFIQEFYAYLGGINLGVAGDQTQHLLWRVQNGELPDVLQPEVRTRAGLLSSCDAFYMSRVLSQGEPRLAAPYCCGGSLMSALHPTASTRPVSKYCSLEVFAEQPRPSNLSVSLSLPLPLSLCLCLPPAP